MSDAQVLVVGAGPVGLVAGAELLRHGVTARVVDVLPEPNLLSKAVGVHARSLEMFEAMGVVDRFLAEGRRINGAEIWNGERLLAHITLDGISSRYPFILDLAQDRTEALLTAHLRELGGEIERGVELVDLVQEPDGVSTTLRHADGREEQALFDYVVGCDGGHSKVRELAPTALKGSFKGTLFVLADVEAETDLDPSMMTMFLHRDGMAGNFPLPGKRVRAFVQVAERLGDGDDPTLEQTQALLDDRIGPRMRLTSAHWLTYFEVHHGQVPRYRFDRVLLAGDAGHIHSPAGGQGMNTGMQDAHNLAWKLALVCRGKAAPSLLDSYDAERHPVGAAVVKTTTLATRMASMTNPVASHARNTLFGVLTGHELPKGRLVDALAELSVAYTHSPIVEEVAPRRHHRDLLQPGRHAPDVELVSADGAATTLASQLSCTRHTALLLGTKRFATSVKLRAQLASELEPFGELLELVAVLPTVPDDAGSDPDRWRMLVDPGGAAAKAYAGRSGTDVLVLVRPDHYVGLVASPPDADAVVHYFRSLLDTTA
jgi:2-polyprenyl-6-methoxyphenol hydroxylase-like FAD-dependent oxidoreductase